MSIREHMHAAESCIRSHTFAYVTICMHPLCARCVHEMSLLHSVVCSCGPPAHVTRVSRLRRRQIHIYITQTPTHPHTHTHTHRRGSSAARGSSPATNPPRRRHRVQRSSMTASCRLTPAKLEHTSFAGGACALGRYTRAACL